MTAQAPTILATSGGYAFGRRSRLRLGPLLLHAVELAQVEGRAARVCFISTAGGDQRSFAAEVDEASRNAGVQVSHLHLFTMPNVPDVRAHLLAQDVIWVGGGSVANLLAVWQVHDLGAALREAWEAGVVLAGVSAGSICWFRGGTTDSFGPDLRAVTNGLALLPYGNGVHYDSEAQRRPLVHELVRAGTLPETHCTDDGVGIRYEGTTMVEAVTEQPGKGAYVVTLVDGEVVEERIEPRLLPPLPDET
ncbi:Type 1 glutamine amidotransferase-like domain-containing protein [Angustibacter aerolatus]